MSAAEGALVRGWWRAIREPGLVGALERIAEDVAGAVREHKPVCRTSGRCCRFESFGHRLYLTGLEAVWTLSRVAEHDRPDPPRVALAIEQGTCPFQIHGLCSIHTVRPVGCRVYFCDERWRGVQELVAESAVRAVRAVHDEFGVEYRYAEWRSLLTLCAEHPP